MSLWDDIRIEIEDNNLGEIFRARDLIELKDKRATPNNPGWLGNNVEYTDNTLRTELANFAVDVQTNNFGALVNADRTNIHFVRLCRGRYRLAADNEFVRMHVQMGGNVGPAEAEIDNAVAYDLNEHRHRFAAWAAGRAASVRGCRFPVATARQLIDNAGLKTMIANPDNLPCPQNMDDMHSEWRRNMVESEAGQAVGLNHGVAAKLINVYFKSAFVCGGYEGHEKVKALHPPIDRLLLNGLAAVNFGGNRDQWRQFSNNGWSTFGAEEYQEVITLIRDSIGNNPLWNIERHWPGNQ
jgi:hypothetical protein